MVASVVEDEMLFGLENFGVPHDLIEQRVSETLETVGISDLRDREIATLSGGQKQKVAIAAILAMRPRVLVLDEPTAALDPASSTLVFETLREANRVLGITIVVVEQKVALLSEYCNRVFVLNHGEIALQGEPHEVFAHTDELRAIGVDCPRVTRIFNSLEADGLVSGTPCLDVDEAERLISGIVDPAHAAIEAQAPTGSPHAPSLRPHAKDAEPVLTFDHVEFAYPNGGAAVHDLSLTLYPGELVGIVGQNGAGKTTVFNMLTGVYKPDKFSWSGGTGKVNITCDKVTIKNGQALATIVFSSSAYQYVKANGNKYLPTHTGGKSIFVIPVELNKNNTIIGMTTKMSAAHEITYSILVYLAAADGDGSGSASGDGGLNFGTNKKLDEKAPDIIGLEYKSETKLDYAKYFKIYHYDKDVTLLEIDMTKDTDNDPDKVKEDTEDNDTKKSDTKKTSTKTDSKKASKTSTKKTTKTDSKTTKTDSKTTDSESVTYSDEGEVIGKTQEERTADLYRANVVKYLIVPEDSDVELPVGIEKEMIVVNLPVKHAYVDSEESLNTMDELKLLKKIAAVGFDQDETDIDAVNEALEEEDMIYAGSGEDLKFRELVKNKVDLAIVSSEILPGSKTEKAAKEEEEKDSKTTKTADTSTDKTDSKTKTADSKTTTADTDTEETTVLDSLADNFATLEVPLIVDRSGDEKTELAKAEWLKVYGAVFGCSKKTDKLYNKVVKAAESKKK